MKPLTSTKITSFQKKIFKWWEANRRVFPWRETTEPYAILVSELMLQQTQAPRVVEKFNQFVEVFPDLESLAKAQKFEILQLWSGLGYNRRAIWLQEAAQMIIERKEFPNTPEELQKMKGIGKYSAHSILIFAFNYDLATVDTNIRRILVAEKFAEEKTSERDLWEIAKKLVPKGRSRDWHNALMDYGSIELTVAKTGIKPLTKQGKFKGSDREYRGKILKLLLESKKITINQMITVLNLQEVKLESILQKMVKENLIKKKGKYYSV